MICYPDEVKKLPQYKDFIARIKEIEKSGYTELNKRDDKKEAEKKYGIFTTPSICNNKCPYKEICNKELKKMWKKVLSNNIDATAFRRRI